MVGATSLTLVLSVTAGSGAGCVADRLECGLAVGCGP